MLGESVMIIMALYLRLLKEDGNLVDESNNIINQRYRLCLVNVVDASII